MLIWGASIIVETIYVVRYNFASNKPPEYIRFISILGFFVLFGINILLGIFGLIPTSLFINTFVAFSIIFIGYSSFLLHDSILKYKSYLARSLNFVQTTADLFILMSIIYIIAQVGSGIRLLNPFKPDNISILGLIIFKVIVILLFVKFTYDYLIDIKVNERRDFNIPTLIIAGCTAVIEVSNFVILGEFEFWWIAVYTLLISIFYTAHSPTERKSSALVYILCLLFVLFLTLNTLQLNPFTWINDSGTVLSLAENIIGVLGLMGGSVGVWKLIEKSRKKNEQTYIDASDVEKAVIEIINKKGFSLNSINDIINISILSNSFDVCQKVRQIVEDRKHLMSPDLFSYFQIYLLTAQFTEQHSVEILDQDNSVEKSSRILENSNELKRYLGDLFPTSIRNLSVYNSYINNDYVRNYIDIQRIEESKPSKIFDKVRKFLGKAIIILVVLGLILGQLPISLFSSIPTAISHVVSWGNLRTTEFKLNLSEAFEPYQNEDERNYYAYSIFNWTTSWEDIVGQREGNDIFLDTEDINREIHWLELILSFYDNKDSLYYETHRRLGFLYRARGDNENAINHLTQVLTGTEDDQTRDNIIMSLAQIYLSEGATDKATELLETTQNNQGYPRSKVLLAEIYLSEKHYDEIRDLLKPISNLLEPDGLLLLGISYYHVGAPSESADIFEHVIDSNVYQSDPRIKAVTSYYLGRIYYQEQDFFFASEYFYQALAMEYMYVGNFLPPNESERILHYFKVSVDTVQEQNPSDYRVNLWYFVYYLYNEDYETAFQYFGEHHKNSRNYEPEFTEYIISLISDTEETPE